MTPRHVVAPSPIGELTIVAEEGAITRVHMDAAKHRPSDVARYGEPADPTEEPFASAVRQYCVARLPS